MVQCQQTLIISKTNGMMFSNMKSMQTFIFRRFSGVKYLGVYIDDKLNSKDTLHIYAIIYQKYTNIIQS